MAACLARNRTGIVKLLAIFTLLPILVTPSLQIGGEDNRTALYLLGLFPIDSQVWASGESALPAAEMAIQHINERPDILPGYELKLLWRDSQCDPGSAIDGAYTLIYEEPTKIMILGPMCSAACQAVARAVRKRHIVQMSYGCAVPSLSDKSVYPRFSRLVPPDSAHNDGRIALMLEFGWTKVATIHEALDLFAETMSDMIHLMEDKGIKVVSSDPLYDDPRIPMEKIKEMGTRIIIGYFYQPMGIKVFCEAYKLGLYGPKYGWLIQGWYVHTWIQDSWVDGMVDCTQEQIAEVVDGAFSVFNFDINPEIDQPGISGMAPKEYFGLFDEYVNHTADTLFGLHMSPTVYDTVWALSLALNATMTKLAATGDKRLENYTYGDEEISDMITQSISEVAFDGVYGKIAFLENGDVTTDFKVQQYQGANNMKIGIYKSEPHILEFYPDVPVVWKGDGPPVAELSIIYVIQRVPVYLYSIMSVLAIAGMICSIIFLTLNIKLRQKRIVKMSSPNINNIILCGCALTYVSVLFAEIGNSTLSPENIWKCSSYTLLLGFSASYGALFSKTWRVHMIFTNIKLQKKVVRDRQLLILVFIFIGIDLITIAFWEGLDPVESVVSNLNRLPEEIGDRIYIQQIQSCESRYMTYWLGIIYSTKALLLVFGVFLAWETRKVSIPVLNDSRHIGMCIYNVVILSTVGAPVAYVLRSQPGIAYGMQSLVVLLGTTVTQCLVILPKIMAYRAGEDIPMGTSSIRPTMGQVGTDPHLLASDDRTAGTHTSAWNSSTDRHMPSATGRRIPVSVGVQVELLPMATQSSNG